MLSPKFEKSFCNPSFFFFFMEGVGGGGQNFYDSEL